MKKKLMKLLNVGLLSFCTVSGLSLNSCSSTSGTSSTVISESEKYVITLHFNDGKSRDQKLFVEKGKSVTLPTDYVCAGKSFAGWKDKDGNPVAAELTPTADMELTAYWTVGICTVTFDVGYEGGSNFTKTIEYGSCFAFGTVETPSRANYTFKYWSTTPDGVECDLTKYTITGDFTFYAVWRSANVEVFTVTIKAGKYTGSPKDASVKIESGEALKKSNSKLKMTRKGYDLAGFTLTAPTDGSCWTLDDVEHLEEDMPELITLPFYPTESCTIWAVWTVKQYTVVFNYNYTDSPTSNGVYQSGKVLPDTPIVPPSVDPVRTDYDFDGWYTAARGGTKVDFTNETVSVNTGYYAHWKHHQVVTNIFHAEYVEFDPNTEYFGYSGSVKGANCIVPDSGTAGVVLVDEYPLNSVLTSRRGHYVAYQSEKGDTLRFEITSDKATTATLKANLMVENATIAAIGSTGDYATKISVNGTALDYSLNLSTAFQVVTISSINLNAGVNVIEIVVDNSSTILGGTYRAAGFDTDYIQIDDTDAVLSYSPIYDNLEVVA